MSSGFLTRTTATTLNEKVLKIPSNAVHRQLIQIVKLEVNIFVGVSNITRIDRIHPIKFAKLEEEMKFVKLLKGVTHVAVSPEHASLSCPK
jgi:hypothetical protein